MMQNLASSSVKEKGQAQRALQNARRAPKSRNGCLRCKAKRLKCDEGKPECYQCIKKNIECPGYKSKALVWSTKHEKLLSNPSDEPLPQSSRTLALNLAKSVSGKGKEDVGKAIDPTSGEAEQETVAESPASIDVQSPNGLGNSRRVSGTYTDSLSAIRQQLHRSTVPEFLLHLPTMLVEYYFSYVCQIFSSFDGTLNPFRSTVGRLWDGSAPIYYAIQSMAAAYLANHFPRMSPVGMQMQRETYRSLYQVVPGSGDQSENLDKTLLAVLLVGQTTAWHDPKDLGLVHLKTAKRLNKRRLEQQVGGTDSRVKRQNEFFEQCILYWDMLAGFVEDDIAEFGFGQFDTSDLGTSMPSRSDTTASGDDQCQIFPHPWTGVAPQVQRLFAQVGQLIRSYRKTKAEEAASSLDFLSLNLSLDMDFQQDSLATIEATTKAKYLEEELLAFSPPPISTLVDAGDENTPAQHYIFLAEAYRCAALLEIYRVFPSILFTRVPLTDTTFAPSTSSSQLPFLPIPTTQPPSDFLISLAIYTLSLLECLPSTSGTRCLQPIVLIAAASELRFSPPDPLSPFLHSNSSSIFNSLTNREVDIASARRFAVTRLQEFQLSLPAKPIVKAEMLVKETWERADLGQEVFWMDVMDEMGWRKIFG